MKPMVNLASEPFRNRRLFWLFILLLFAVSSLVGLRSLGSISDLDAQIVRLEPQVKELEGRVRKDGPAASTAAAVSSLSPAQNQALLAASELIGQKSFSWSQFLNDLEQHIPPTVRVIRIGVDKSGTKNSEGKRQTEPGQKEVQLTFEVIGQSAGEVTKMLADLNRSDRFSVRPREQRQVEGTDEVNFMLDLKYRPLMPTPRVALSSQVAAQEVRK